MQVNNSNPREDIETTIEECQERIREYRYEIRWDLRALYTFWGGVVRLHY